MKTKPVVTKISKWGNGYGIRIPASMLGVYKMTAGSEVTLVNDNNGVTITPRTPSLADLSLEEIMKGVTPTQLKKDEANSVFGVTQGKEIW